MYICFCEFNKVPTSKWFQFWPQWSKLKHQIILGVPQIFGNYIKGSCFFCFKILTHQTEFFTFPKFVKSRSFYCFASLSTCHWKIRQIEVSSDSVLWQQHGTSGIFSSKNSSIRSDFSSGLAFLQSSCEFFRDLTRLVKLKRFAYCTQTLTGLTLLRDSFCFEKFVKSKCPTRVSSLQGKVSATFSSS